MQTSQYEYLKFVRFRELDNWSARYMINRQVLFNHKFQLNKLSSFLTKGGTITTIDDNGKYKRITVKTKNGGVCLRDIVTGKNIGTKKQWLVSEGLFIISKIDARNGAMGIIPKELNGAIVTNDFPVFNIDKGSIVPQYLLLVTTTERFVEFVQKCSSGTTNRQRVDVNDFLDVKIPIPSLSEQQALVEAYNAKIKTAEEKERRADQLKNEIENYLLSELGIKLKGTYSQNLPESSVCAEPQVEYCINPNPSVGMNDATTYHWGDEIKKEYRWLKFVRFKDVDRWDCYNSQINDFKSQFQTILLSKLIVQKPQYGAAFKSISKKTDVRYIRITDINEDGSLNDEYVSAEKFDEIYLLKMNDFLIARSGNTVGKTFLYEERVGRAIFAGYLIKFVLDTTKINPYYLLAYTKSSIYKTWINNNMRISGQPNINSQQYCNSPIIVPPLEIQNTIVKHITELKEQIKQLKQEAKELRENALVEFEKEIFEN